MIMFSNKQKPINNMFKQPSSNIFGQPTNTFRQPSSNIFGQPTNTFGKPTNTLGQPSSNIFGQPSGNTNIFSQPSGNTNIFSQPSGNTNIFSHPSGNTNIFSQPSGNEVSDPIINSNDLVCGRKHLMVPTIFSGGGYINGWTCDFTDCSKKGMARSNQEYRFCCQICTYDICVECYNKKFCGATYTNTLIVND